MPATAARRRRVHDEMSPDGGKATAGPSEKVKEAEAEPRAQPELVYGCSR